MRSNAPLILLVLAVAAGTGWWVLQTDDPEPDAEPPERNLVTEGTPGPGPDSAADRDPGRVTTAPGEQDRAKTGIETERFREKEGPKFTLALVRRDENRNDVPVPDAQVWVMDMTKETESALRGAVEGGSDIATALTRIARPRAVDAEGKLRLGLPDRNLMAVAMAPGFLGGQPIKKTVEEGEVVLVRMRPRMSVLVRVRRENGEPVGKVPVGLLHGDHGRVSPLARTGPQGIARVTVPSNGAREVSVALAFPTREPVSKKVDPGHPAEEPIDLVLPATGSITVKAEAGNGRAISEGRVFLQRAQDAGADPMDAHRMPRWDGVIDDGVASFPFVGLGLTLNVRVDAIGGVSAEKTGATGPKSAGERVEIVLSGEPTYPVIAFRVVDADGKPLAREHLSHRIATDHGYGGGGTELDDDGRGRVEVRNPYREGSRRHLILFGRKDARGNRDLERVFRHDISRHLDPGINDLGDIQLSPAPVVCSGVVVDTDGNPIGDARVWIEKMQGERRWSTLHTANDLPTTAADGSFAMRGWERLPTDRELRASAGRQGLVLETAGIVRDGARDIRIVLGRAGSIAGSVILPSLRDEVDSGAALIRRRHVTLLVTKDGEPNAFGASIGPDDTFEIVNLKPGSYEFTATLAGTHEPVVSIAGINVVADEVTRDPRLNPIDLTDYLQSIEVLVVDDRGAPIPDALVWVGYKGSRNGSRADERGRRVVTIMKNADDLEISAEAPGYARQVLQGLVSPAKIVLTRGPEIVVRIDPAAVAAVKPFKLQCSLPSMNGNTFRTRWATFGADGEVRIHIGAAGKYAPVLRLEAKGRTQSVHRAARYQDLTLEDGGKVITVPFEPDALDAAKAQLQQRLDRRRRK